MEGWPLRVEHMTLEGSAETKPRDGRYGRPDGLMIPQ